MTTGHRLPRAEVEWDPHALLARAIDAGVDGDWTAAQAIAAIAQAQALLQPSVEEVVGEYESVRTETNADAVARMVKVEAILSTATRDGSRRHPAIHAALEVIRGT